MVAVVCGQSWTDAGNNSWTITTGDVTLGVSTLSGKLTLQRAGNSDSVYVAMDRLVEVDQTTGLDVWKVDLNNVLFGWGAPVTATVNGATVVYMNVNATIRSTLPPLPGNFSGPHKIFIYVYLYQQNGTITFGNDTYTVAKDNVKFSIKITNWEFRAVGNKLRADLALGLNNVNYQPAAIAPRDPMSKTMALSSVGTVDIVNTAICDGVTVDVTAATYGQGGRSGVSITFPYFASELEYDPTVSVSSDTSGASSIAPTALLSLFAVVMAFIAKL
jgi:hypothetical protein